jgi:hypothetical protein
LPPVLIAKCAAEKILPIMRRCGRSLRHDSVIPSEVEGSRGITLS